VQKITSGQVRALYSVAQTRQLENLASLQLPAHALMERAGLAVAKLALALAPHAQRIWIACGPGNNGGDGLEAARHLQRWGKQPIVSWLGELDRAPTDTLIAYRQLEHQGVTVYNDPPLRVDLGIDALLGIGGHLRAPTDRLAFFMNCLNDSAATVLSVDVPSGLDADTGCVSALHVRADHTLSLLTLKPGLFTASGRDAAGTIWCDSLAVDPDEHGQHLPAAQLLARSTPAARPHASHKGSYGDVAIVGGASGMVGAALLSARAALHAGAGRVFVGLLDQCAMAVDPLQPEIMFRTAETLSLANMVTVFGCGGGVIDEDCLKRVLSSESPVVIDADAINKISSEPRFQVLLTHRTTRGAATVLTPHPLEAARLLGLGAAQVQANRLEAAQALSERYACTVALKGSGTIVSAPGRNSGVNPTGNAALATAGTGDVLAGMIGANLAQGLEAFEATCQAVYRHGELADTWHGNAPLTASKLASLPASRVQQKASWSPSPCGT